MERKPFTMYRWCGFHHIPMSVCDCTSSMSCWSCFVEKSFYIHNFLWNEREHEEDSSPERIQSLKEHLEKDKVNIKIVD